jgi:hypothetical protein
MVVDDYFVTRGLSIQAMVERKKVPWPFFLPLDRSWGQQTASSHPRHRGKKRYGSKSVRACVRACACAWRAWFSRIVVFKNCGFRSVTLRRTRSYAANELPERMGAADGQ